MSHQVEVRLRALNGDISPVERVIALNPANTSVPIGRASKSVSKGLLGATDNAWFDSPVMSRDHAELAMSSESKTITIKDIGSMHGTCLNGSEIPKHSAIPVKDGDLILFGTEVKRGSEIFPACRFQITYDFSPYTPGTFKFPDSSEVEDEDNCDYSDDEMIEQPPSSDDGVSICSPSLKGTKAVVEAIDLTGDDAPPGFSSYSIDLTEETAAERQMMNVLAGGLPADINHDVDQTSIGVYAEPLPVLVDAEDEDDKFPFDSEEGSLNSEEGSLNSVSDGSSSDDEDMEEAESSEDDNSEAGKTVEAAYSPSPERLSSSEEMEEDTSIDDIIRFAATRNENTIVRLTELPTLVPEAQLSESGLGEDTEDSDFELEDAALADMKSMAGGDLLCVAKSKPEPDSDVGYSLPNIETLHGTTATSLTPEITQPIQPQVQPQQSVVEDTTAQLEPIIRRPSPSDAAMAKSADPSINDTTHVSVCGWEVGNPSAKDLINKSGKDAFFEAREVNKARFYITENFPSTENLASVRGSSFMTTAQQTTDTRENQKSPPGSMKRTSEPQSHPTVGSHHTVSGEPSKCTRSTLPFGSLGAETIFVSPIRETCSFLDKPDQSPLSRRSRSPSYDMTSAHNYNICKGTNGIDMINTRTVLKNNLRSEIKIDDIIESSSSRQPTKLKRKSAAISDSTDDELRKWASDSPAPSLAKANGLTDDTMTPHAISTQIENPLALSSTPVIAEARPAKRFKKILEKAGYAALGGVAVGAGLFSVLVATAPDYL